MAHKSLTLTIVIPAFNEERYLKACLNSIAKQTEKPDEVIVVDNNSTDKTVEIAHKYPFVKVLREKKQGVQFARNKGFNASKSDIIGRIDADTILPAKWVSIVKTIMSDKNVMAVTGPVNYYDMPMPRSNYRFNHIMCKYTYKWSPKCPFLYGSNMALRRSAWQKVTGDLCTGSDMHEDIDLAIHMRQHDLKIEYNKSMLARASGRRYNDRVSDFSRYIMMHHRVYSRHGLHSVAVYMAMFMWSLGYILIHPWRNIWYWFHSRNNPYPITSERRKNPMSS